MPAGVSQQKAVASVVPEFELLLCCARTQLNEAQAERVRQLVAAFLDWERLLELALAHALMPLLHHNLTAICPELLPPAFRENLRQHFQQNSIRNLFLLGELNRLIHNFEARGLSVIPLKGPALAWSVYGSLNLRQFADLDLFIRKEDLAPATQELIAAGYQTPLRLTPHQEAGYFKINCERLFIRAQDQVNVDLHWSFLPPHYGVKFDYQPIWDRAEELVSPKLSALTLAPEDLLLFLCVHGSKHFWERLVWLVDVAELLRVRPNLDWAGLLQAAERLGVQRMLLLGLHLAKELLATDLPGEIQVRIEKDQAMLTLARRLRAQLVQAEPTAPGLAMTMRFDLMFRERVADKLRYGWRLALTPTLRDLRLLNLPGSLYAIYYLLRPFRLAHKYARVLINRRIDS